MSGTADRHTRAIGRVLRDVDRVVVGGGRVGQQGRIGRGWKKTAPVCGGVPVAVSCKNQTPTTTATTARSEQRRKQKSLSLTRAVVVVARSTYSR